MNNKNLLKSIAFFVALLLLCPCVFAADPLDTSNLVIEKNCASNETITFQKSDFTELYGKDGKNLKGIIVTELPKSDSGKLYLSDKDVNLYDTITMSQIDEMVFEPSNGSDVKTVSFDFKAYSSKDFMEGEPTVSIQLNDPDVVVPQPKSVTLKAIKDIAVNGFFKTEEPSLYGDVRFVIAQAPRYGEVTLAADGVSFVYSPDINKTGKDSFSYYAQDTAGNTSDTATVSVEIKPSKNDFYYEDLTDHWAHYAALTLAQKGIITGEKIGDKSFFYPDKVVTRGDFLVMLMQTCGLSDDLPECTDTGFADDAQIPEYLKKYVQKAVETGIISGSLSDDGTLTFNATSSVTRMQAAKMINAAANLSDVKATMRSYTDADNVPVWAVQSVVNLSSQGILKGYDDNSIRPTATINKAQTAELLCQLLNYQESTTEKNLGVFGFIKNIFS